MYSAVKKEGRKLYELARQGIVISREPRTIKVSKIDILSFQDNEVEIRIACSKGTYVRTLGEDLAENIGAVCTMTSLLREKSGIFSIEDAKTLKEIEEIFRSDKIGTIIINTDTVFLNLPEVFLPEDECKKYKNGLKFLPQGIKCDIPFRVYGPDGEFVAIAELKEDLGEKIIRPVKNFF